MPPDRKTMRLTTTRVPTTPQITLASKPAISATEAILSYRTEYGAFRSVEDLLGVPGIGEQKLASLRDRVVVP